MVTMAQRIEALRTEAGLARVPASLALGFPKNAFEKFETGRRPLRRSSRKSWPPISACPCFTSGGRATTVPGRRTG